MIDSDVISGSVGDRLAGAWPGHPPGRGTGGGRQCQDRVAGDQPRTRRPRRDARAGPGRHRDAGLSAQRCRSQPANGHLARHDRPPHRVSGQPVLRGAGTGGGAGGVPARARRDDHLVRGGPGTGAGAPYRPAAPRRRWAPGGARGAGSPLPGERVPPCHTRRLSRPTARRHRGGRGRARQRSGRAAGDRAPPRARASADRRMSATG